VEDRWKQEEEAVSGLFRRGGGKQFGAGRSEMTRTCHDNGGPDGETVFLTPPPLLKEECWGGAGMDHTP
jgi:hypothetical protein